MLKSFFMFLYAAALASVVLAQNITIIEPRPNTTVPAGGNITVQLGKPGSLTGSREVAVAIGFSLCNKVCPDVADILGNVVYIGPYNATAHNDSISPYENFTVTLPITYHGLVQLGVAHVYLLGAGASPSLQTLSTTLLVD